MERQELLAEAFAHINEKYGPKSDLKFWLAYERNVANLQEVHAYLAQPEQFRDVFEELYEQLG